MRKSSHVGEKDVAHPCESLPTIVRSLSHQCATIGSQVCDVFLTDVSRLKSRRKTNGSQRKKIVPRRKTIGPRRKKHRPGAAERMHRGSGRKVQMDGVHRIPQEELQRQRRRLSRLEMMTTLEADDFAGAPTAWRAASPRRRPRVS